MFWNFFTRDKASFKPRNINNISRKELLVLTNQHFGTIFHCFQVEILFKVSHLMLQQLQMEDENFDRNYDSIIFGTIVVAKAVYYWKYQRPGSQYALTRQELMEKCEVLDMADLGFDSAVNDIRVQNLIRRVGEKVLDQVFPFGEDEFKLLNCSGLTDHVSVRQRFDRYLPVEVRREESEFMGNVNLFSWPRCSIL